jgi:ribosomal protein L32
MTEEGGGERVNVSQREKEQRKTSNSRRQQQRRSYSIQLKRTLDESPADESCIDRNALHTPPSCLLVLLLVVLDVRPS